MWPPWSYSNEASNMKLSQTLQNNEGWGFVSEFMLGIVGYAIYIISYPQNEKLTQVKIT